MDQHGRYEASTLTGLRDGLVFNPVIEVEPRQRATRPGRHYRHPPLKQNPPGIWVGARRKDPPPEEGFFERVEEEIEEEFKKGVEWVEGTASDAIEIAKDAGSAVLDTVETGAGAAWGGVKDGLHAGLDLATEGLEAVWDKVEIPVLVVGGSLLAIFVGIPAIRAIRGTD